MSIVSEHGFRLDGRRPHQIRNISASLGTIRDAEGSAYFEQGGTKILCAVYGPYEGKRSKQLEDRCSDGSHLAACVNAASLAMSDAGIPMKGLVAAATCSIVDGQPVVDVNQREETDILPRLTLATLRGEDEVVLVELQNRVHVDHLPALMAAAKDTCKGVHECICAAIVDQLENGAFFLR
ncbi:3' exoribonuclease family, domain 1 [Ancylostoma ceylanicum]|uniref:3' exoribonuclease family, domain 1 n=1 Tax=Ancylostoma ceylanicum TaxID=53326 RepID=A0A0D6LWX7_9BILA|nr:3' exoribonuclease family, domain 1 [Ancylostoma ceylanicum]